MIARRVHEAVERAVEESGNGIADTARLPEPAKIGNNSAIYFPAVPFFSTARASREKDSTLLGPGPNRVDSEIQALLCCRVRCPHCHQKNSARRFRRAGIYPVPVALLALSYYFALLWIAGRPWLWHCSECGAEFTKHSGISILLRILGWIVLVGILGILLLSLLLNMLVFAFGFRS